MPDSLNVIPEAQREQFVANMNLLREAYPQTPDVESTFLNTCAMVPGLSVLSDPQARDLVHKTFYVNHSGYEVGARL